MSSSAEQHRRPTEPAVSSRRQSNVLAAHFNEYCGRLDENAPSLFSDESDLIFLEKPFRDAAPLRRNLTSLSEWNELLSVVANTSAEHFYFIHKKHSWSRLSISYDLLKNLISHYSIFSSFLRIVRSFGVKISEGGPSCGFFFRILGGHELHYSFRYVEKNGRNLSNPWSMRQMAVCNRTNIEKCFSTWIIVHPSKTLQERLSATREVSIASLDRLEALELCTFSSHLIIILNGLENWSLYLEYLSSEFKSRCDRALTCKITKATSKDDDEFEIGIEDMQWIQWLIQHLHVVRSNLLENTEAINGLRGYTEVVLRENGHYDNHKSSSISAQVEFLTWLSVWGDELKSILLNSDLLMKQARDCSGLIYNIIKIKDNEVIQMHGKMLNSMAERSNEFGELVLDLTLKTQKTARSMQTLTFLTLIYLPPSFLASLFGMNFFVVSDTDGAPRIKLIRDSWLYFAAVLPLTMLTVAIWRLWDKRKH